MKKLFTLISACCISLACAFAQTDYTGSIKNPSFEANGFDGWENSGLQTQNNNDFPMKAGNVYVEKWTSQGTYVGNACVQQLLSGLPMGKYRLTAGAMNYSQKDTEQLCEGAVLFAGDATTPVYLPDDYDVEFSTVTGEVLIGFRATNAKGNWVACDNFRLTYIEPVDFSLVMPELNALIAQAEAFSGKCSDASAANLAAAIAAAKAVTENTPQAEIQSAITALTSAMAQARISAAEFEALEQAIADAAPLDGKNMNAEVKARFDAALAAARAITSASSSEAVNNACAELIDATALAAASAADYQALAQAIAKAEAAAAGNEALANATADALNAAKQAYETGSADADSAYALAKAIADAQLSFNLAHASGNVPAVTTHPYVARGCRIAFGRMQVDANGEKIIEQGFCWAENPEPTVLDERSADFYNHAGQIFIMKDIKPATKYYVRAYAITEGYQVGYGKAIKVVTLPAANCTWSWERNDATDEEDARCQKACAEAISNYNYCSGFRGFHLSAHYVKGAGAGNGTADCSYGGWMRISQNVPYQRTGTVQHETNHGVGVGTTDRWRNNADLRADVTRGYWLGRRANELVNFFENTPNGTVIVTGDGTHMWAVNPDGKTTGILNYGINGAHEDSGQQLLYYANAMLTEYICEDGLNPTSSYHNGMPCYTFDFEEDCKYYLVNESMERGFTQGAMLRADNGKLRWNTSGAITDDAAWNFEYNYEEGYYRLRNVKTGQYLSHNGKAISMQSVSEPSAAEEFQLVPSRLDINMGSYTTYGYWLSWVANSMNVAIRANELNENQGYGVYNGANFLFGNADTNQRFVIVSEDDIEAFLEKASGIQSVFAPAERTIVGIYTIDGKLINEMRPGLNIIRYSDGSAEKLYK